MSSKKLYLGVVGGFIGLIAGFEYLGVIVNITPSLPYGIYVKSSKQISDGDYLAFCLDGENQKLGLARKYLEGGSACAGSTPLIKKVVALPFESVYLSESFVIANGVKLNLQTLHHDSHGRSLVTYPHGEYRANCYWLIGDYDSVNSWDSRYWGCVSAEKLLYRVKPIITWK